MLKPKRFSRRRFLLSGVAVAGAMVVGWGVMPPRQRQKSKAPLPLKDGEVALNGCSGAIRNISEATVGYWYRLYQGESGRIEQGNQVAYIRRNLWSGTGPTLHGSDFIFYTSLRFYLP